MKPFYMFVNIIIMNNITAYRKHNNSNQPQNQLKL